MTKEITVDEFREHFTERLEEVRHGVTLRLLDGGAIVATMSPGDLAEPLVMTAPVGRMEDIVLPPPLPTERDIVDYLLEERGDR
jgi:antitoxin (DNA-binding transcriptional repressor) of toxin-antitoxin stability system